MFSSGAETEPGENPFCGGILRLSTRLLVAGQEGPEQPQLSSSQLLPKQSVLEVTSSVASCVAPNTCKMKNLAFTGVRILEM